MRHPAAVFLRQWLWNLAAGRPRSVSLRVQLSYSPSAASAQAQRHNRTLWIDQSQSVNLFLATPDMQGASARNNLNRSYRRAWDKGLKTTYSLRTLQASNVEKSTIDVKKEHRSHMATATAAGAAKTYPPRGKNVLLHRAMMNGGECEACQ